METISGYFASLRSSVLLRDEWRLPRSHNPPAYNGLCSLLNHTKSRVKYRYTILFWQLETTTTMTLFLVSIDNLISPIICILSGSLQQKFGPRTILILNCLPYLLSWIGAVLSGLFTNIWFLYISRLIFHHIMVLQN